MSGINIEAKEKEVMGLNDQVITNFGGLVEVSLYHYDPNKISDLINRAYKLYDQRKTALEELATALLEKPRNR